jgi:hypothetical protein
MDVQVFFWAHLYRKKLVGLRRCAPYGYVISNDIFFDFIVATIVASGARRVSRNIFRIKRGDFGQYREPLS